MNKPHPSRPALRPLDELHEDDDDSSVIMDVLRDVAKSQHATTLRPATSCAVSRCTPPLERSGDATALKIGCGGPGNDAAGPCALPKSDGGEPTMIGVAIEMGHPYADSDEAVPGAYAVGWSGGPDAAAAHSQQERNERGHEDESGFPQAVPVSEFPVATPVRGKADTKRNWRIVRSPDRCTNTIALLLACLLFGIYFPLFIKKYALPPDAANMRHIQIETAIQDAFGEDYFDSPIKEQALHWITYEDSLQSMLEKEENHDGYMEHLVQRFSLVVFYFHTSSQKPWAYCNPPTGRQSNLCILPKKYVNRDTTEQGIRWLSPDHECHWIGVTCPKGSRIITEIEMNDNNITGTIPSELAVLTNMTRLAIPRNHLSGTLPDWIGRLSRLETLQISGNQLSGTIPTAYLQIPTLVYLLMADNLLTGSIPSEINCFHNDIAVFLGGRENGVKGCKLFLQNNLLTGAIPQELYSLSELKSLNLQHNMLTGILSSRLGQMSTLNYFDLAGCHLLQGTIPSEIGLLHSSLGYFGLEGTSITGTIPKQLYSINTLYHLRLSDTHLSGTISSELGLLTKLTRLDLSDNNFSGTIPKEISSLSNMKSFHVDGNQNLSGSIPMKLCSQQLNHQEDFVADCLSMEASGIPAVSCPDGCCAVCCDAKTNICLET